ncbi:hypothetical protein LEMLEM_LOCUS1637 [Lemmus lemmus]
MKNNSRRITDDHVWGHLEGALAAAGLCPHMTLSVTLHMTGPFLP